MITMILNRYEIFLKTAEIGNITKTAEILHYTQAGISHALSLIHILPKRTTPSHLLWHSAIHHMSHKPEYPDNRP